VRSWSAVARAAGLLEPIPDIPAVQQAVANAAARGAQVDDACAKLMLGQAYSLAKMSDDSLKYLYAFAEYWQDYRSRAAHREIFVQTPLYCAGLDFCTTPDFHTRNGVFDIKATWKPSRTWGLQLAAQALANDCTARTIVWLRPKMKTRTHEVFSSTGPRPDPRVFSELDFDVVRAAAKGDYEADVIKRWKEAA